MTTTYASLRDANVARQKEWDKDDNISLSYRGNELAGETGEACNVIKKLERERLGIRGTRDTVEHLAEELADVVICSDLIAMHEGIDLNAAVAAKFNATSEKVGLSIRLDPDQPTRVTRLHNLLSDVLGLIDPERHGDLVDRINAELLPCDRAEICPAPVTE